MASILVHAHGARISVDDALLTVAADNAVSQRLLGAPVKAVPVGAVTAVDVRPATALNPGQVTITAGGDVTRVEFNREHTDGISRLVQTLLANPQVRRLASTVPPSRDLPPPTGPPIPGLPPPVGRPVPGLPAPTGLPLPDRPVPAGRPVQDPAAPVGGPRPAPPSMSAVVSAPAEPVALGQGRRLPGAHAHWFGPGQAVRVGTRVLPGGLLYVGTSLPSGNGHVTEPALINPHLRVDDSRPDWDAKTATYWPRYDSITPRARLAYLSWLEGGRKQTGPVTWPFLFLYGLEHRVLVDAPAHPLSGHERAAIRAEVERLLGMYGSNSRH